MSSFSLRTVCLCNYFCKRMTVQKLYIELLVKLPSEVEEENRIKAEEEAAAAAAAAAKAEEEKKQVICSEVTT